MSNGNNEADRFCPVSLGDWLALCRQAGVPHIPAERIATIGHQDWRNHAALKAEGGEGLDHAFKQGMLTLRRRHILRYDFCAPTAVKSIMAAGNDDFSSEMAVMTLDDRRVYDLPGEYPRDQVPIWQRPRIPAAIQDGYPVEYRSFVTDGGLDDISSYYPHKPLELNEEHLA